MALVYERFDTPSYIMVNKYNDKNGSLKLKEFCSLGQSYGFALYMQPVVFIVRCTLTLRETRCVQAKN